MNSITSLPSNWQCHKTLFKIVWGTNNCPDCGGKILFRPGYEWCKVCRLKTSVKGETWLRHSNLSFRQIWLLIWCWQHKESIGSTRKLCSVSYPTIRKWFRRFRLVLPKDETNLQDLVEVDESAFGKQKFGRQTWIAGAIERGSRRIKLKIVPDRGRDTLEQFVMGSIKAGSHINTDAWGAYSEIGLLGYTHDFCNHSIGHFGETNLIENLWSVIKRHLRSLYGRLTITDLDLILNEWEIRQNQPSLMYNVSNYLHATACSCSGLFE
jgi:hypothetical protein